MSKGDHQSDYLDDVLARLDSVVSDLAELSLSSLPVEQLNRVLLRECELVSQAQGLQMAAIQEAETAGMSARYGTRILTTHLANETHQPTKTLGSARSVAMWLTDFPLLHQALIAGDMSQSHIAELKAIDNPRTHRLLIRDQQMLADAARQVVWTDWKNVIAYWLTAADPRWLHADHIHPHSKNGPTNLTNGEMIDRLENQAKRDR